MSLLTYRSDIDGLRAIAVLSVLIYHLNPTLLPGGFLGVDIFFVISGYLISLILFKEIATHSFHVCSFYARRIRRLFPALALVIVFTLIFGFYALFPAEYKQLAKHASASIVFLFNLVVMNEAGYFDIVSEAKPLLHLWSLSVEEQFYLIWPLFLLLCHRFRISISIFISTSIVFSFGCSLYLAQHDIDILFFHPLARFWELMFGALLAYWHYNQKSNASEWRLALPWAHQLISTFSLLTIIISLFLIDGNMPHPGPGGVVLIVATTLFIGCGEKSFGNRLLSARLLVWIGLISYPLYLWHWPILSYIRIMEGGTPSVAVLWVAAALSIILAGLTYSVIERPIRACGQSGLQIVCLVSIMGVLLIISQGLVISNGLPNRSSLQYAKDAETQMIREPQQDQSCLALFPDGNAPIYCRMNKADGPMIAVIGDSHAHVLYPGVAELGSKSGLGALLLANSGCPPFLGTTTGRNASEDAQCVDSIETILSTVVNISQVKWVVIASRGPIYITGKGFGVAEKDVSIQPIKVYEYQEERRKFAPEQAFMYGLVNTVRRLQSGAKHVSYFLEVPELGVTPSNCIGRPLAISKDTRCEVAYSEYSARMLQYRSIIKAVKLQSPQLNIIDPEPIFCSGATCIGILDRFLLYADDDHLSVNGSKIVAPLILQSFNLQSKPVQ
ncbi:acyltransferase family protein [Desulfogranum japonicum]|uniref:acyltransferase family protein n=1 Tax=Desulfogranum japonicum TaxID=231447 RepID=UPI00041DF5E0|nr:acyltransferase family protein [Desulfogranum japonicum]